MLKRYTPAKTAADNEQPMPLEELLQYLKNIDNFDLTPLESVLLQTEAIGDPALPTRQQTAILQWLGTALHNWQQRYPLEQPLASELLPLHALAAALAVTDPNFLIPGAHPIHRLLDTLQASAIGWHSRLGRAGKVMEQQVARTVGDALAWFEDRNTDLTTICNELDAATEKDRARAGRMAQRVVEAEQGRIKSADAKRQAAGMINAALERFEAPEAIGAFLTGPWYASAQLVVLKFGSDSEPWEKMAATTDTLLDSLQTIEEPAENRRQYIFEVVTQLPKDINRLLLSLRHDNEAVEDAVGLIEFTHLRVLRNQPLELEQIDPIVVTSDIDTAQNSDHFNALDGIEAGQWFRIDKGDDDPQRVQLALKMEREQQLLFTSQAGIKALQLSYREFADMLVREEVTPLYSGASFSSSLSSAAGIDSTEQLQILSAAEQAWHEEETQQPQPAQEDPEEVEKQGEAITDAAAREQDIDESPGQEITSKSGPGTEPGTDLNLPMGTWLGFHDGHKPLMAKLAVHDRELDQYIFVNREGIKILQLDKQVLLQMMDDGLVDILQADSSFREKVTLAQHQLKE